MSRNVSHSILDNAKTNKKDEFYTQREDIDRELQYYEQSFYGKSIFCNCDSINSNFYKYFTENFQRLHLKKVVCSYYIRQNQTSLYQHAYYYIYDGSNASIPDKNELFYYTGDGDFRSKECLELLKKSDIIVTNPPFSLFREFVAQIIEYDKKFLIIGNINAITYKDIFSLIKNNKVWLGVNLGRGISGFIVPESYELYGTEARIDKSGNRIIATNNCLWLTNLNNHIRNSFIKLTKKYKGNEAKYQKYDNFDAINVNKSNDIPLDYDGFMGVPITFLHKYNPEQFEIIKFRKGNDNKDLSINGKCPYFRIIIKKITKKKNK